MKSRRKSQRIVLRTSFSRFSNNKENPITMDESDEETSDKSNMQAPIPALNSSTFGNVEVFSNPPPKDSSIAKPNVWTKKRILEEYQENMARNLKAKISTGQSSVNETVNDISKSNVVETPSQASNPIVIVDSSSGPSRRKSKLSPSKDIQ